MSDDTECGKIQLNNAELHKKKSAYLMFQDQNEFSKLLRKFLLT